MRNLTIIKKPEEDERLYFLIDENGCEIDFSTSTDVLRRKYRKDNITLKLRQEDRYLMMKQYKTFERSLK